MGREELKVPKVSVLIPTFNYARYLPEAIESVLEQDLRDFELLISDDCSSDNSAEVIARYAAKDHRIRVQIHPQNLGMVRNWNWCLSEARGPYAKFLFGDDRLASRSALSQLVGLLESNPSAIIASSPRFLIDENSNVIKVRNHLEKPGLHQGTKVIEQCLMRNGNLVGEPSIVLFRTHEARRGFSEEYHQLVDVEMWFHLLERGDLVYAAEPLGCFRRHQRQQTELNRSQLVGIREGAELALHYRSKPYLGKWAVCNILGSQLYAIRKSRRKTGAGTDARLLQMELELTEHLGQAFWMFWVRRRTIRPVENLLLWLRGARHLGMSQFAIAGASPCQPKEKRP